MTTTLKPFVQGAVLTAAAAAYYTTPASTRAVIKSATMVNTTGAPVAGTVYLVPSGGAAAAANTFISGRTLAAGESYTCPELVNHVLTAGGTIHALGLGITFAVSGAEVV